MKKTVYNAMAFNIAWPVCVLGGNAVAVLVACVLCAVHLMYLSGYKREVWLLVVITLIGIVFDHLLLRSGLLIAPDQSLVPPLWLISLWAMFATTLNHSMKWFQGRWLISAVVGGVAGFTSYLAGTGLTDFSLQLPLPMTLLIIFILWCLIFPLCLYITQKMLPEPSN